MLFKTERISEAITKLIDIECAERVLDTSKYEIVKTKKDREELVIAYEERMHQRPINIKYLQELRRRIKANPSEATLVSLLQEIEGLHIKVGDRVLTFGQIFEKNQWGLTHRKNQDIAPHDVLFYYQKRIEGEPHARPLEFLKHIHDQLNTQLSSLRSANTMNGVYIIGIPDETGKINSPAIREFISTSAASNKEIFPNDDPPALFDFRRGININGRGFPNISLDELKKEIHAFLQSSHKLRDDPKTTRALSNFMLKNGQSLQSIFTDEFIDRSLHRITAGEFHYSIGDNNIFYNWTIDAQGELRLDMELDIKSIVQIPDSENFDPEPDPFILDSQTGMLRESDKEKDDRKNCPTIIKYKASITFEISKEAPAFKSLAFFQTHLTSETIATPVVKTFDVTVYNDKIQYTPTLTNFTQLEIIHQPKPP